MSAATRSIGEKPKPARRQIRKCKAEPIAPDCRENCQIAHTIEQTAALLSCSVSTVMSMIEAGRLAVVRRGLGEKPPRRVCHSELYKL